MQSAIATIQKRLAWALGSFRIVGANGAFDLFRLAAMRNGAELPAVAFPVRALGHRPVHVRPGTSDITVFLETFIDGYHLPPATLKPDSVRRVWDLGSNIGLTIAHYAQLFPRASISGVELDERTAAVARSNIRSFGARCAVFTGAVWHEDGTVEYLIETGSEYAARVTEPRSDRKHRRAPCYSLNTLLRQDTWVDFMKMDIEGAEQAVLKKNTEWAERVGCLKVEVHSPYTVEECEADLRRLGFWTDVDRRHWAAVTGIRMCHMPAYTM